MLFNVNCFRLRASRRFFMLFLRPRFSLVCKLDAFTTPESLEKLHIHFFCAHTLLVKETPNTRMLTFDDKILIFPILKFS